MLSSRRCPTTGIVRRAKRINLAREPRWFVTGGASFRRVSASPRPAPVRLRLAVSDPALEPPDQLGGLAGRRISDDSWAPLAKRHRLIGRSHMRMRRRDCQKSRGGEPD